MVVVVVVVFSIGGTTTHNKKKHTGKTEAVKNKMAKKQKSQINIRNLDKHGLDDAHARLFYEMVVRIIIILFYSILSFFFFLLMK